ncbi:hypothetical protein ACJX0J_018371, partial [Zea mays]
PKVTFLIYLNIFGLYLFTLTSIGRYSAGVYFINTMIVGLHGMFISILVIPHVIELMGYIESLNMFGFGLLDELAIDNPTLNIYVNHHVCHIMYQSNPGEAHSVAICSWFMEEQLVRKYIEVVWIKTGDCYLFIILAHVLIDDHFMCLDDVSVASGAIPKSSIAFHR